MTITFRLCSAFVLLSFFSSSALACLCSGSRSVDDFYHKYDHIFVARITGLDLVEDSVTSDEIIIAKFEVLELFQGNPDDVVVSADALGFNFSTCSTHLVVGSYYLIFAANGEPTHLGRCSASQPITYEEKHVSPSVHDLRRLFPTSAP